MQITMTDTTNWIEIKQKLEDDCPHCGRCKHCGRPEPYYPTPQPSYPNYPYQPTYPSYMNTPWMTYQTWC